VQEIVWEYLEAKRHQRELPPEALRELARRLELIKAPDDDQASK
jgi:hypothetical protein